MSCINRCGENSFKRRLFVAPGQAAKGLCQHPGRMLTPMLGLTKVSLFPVSGRQRPGATACGHKEVGLTVANHERPTYVGR